MKYFFIVLLGAALSVMPAPAGALQWSQIYSPTEEHLRDIWGNAADNIYIAGGYDTTVLHYNGMTWRDLEAELPFMATADTWSIWGLADDTVFTVGGWSYWGLHRGNILYYDGDRWRSLTATPNSILSWTNELRSIWGTSKSDIFAVGQRNYVVPQMQWVGPVLHYDGSRVYEMDNPRESIPDADLYDVWGSSSADVYAVGVDLEEVCVTTERVCTFFGLICTDECVEFETYDHSNMMHYDGTGWQHIETAVDADLYAIWGSAADSVYAAGEAGAVIFFDGSAWSQMDSGTDEDLFGIWGTATDDVFAVGGNGVILHFDGSTWSPMESPSPLNLQSVWGSYSRQAALSESNDLADGPGYASARISRLENGCVTLVIEANTDLLPEDSNFGIQQIGFNYSGDADPDITVEGADWKLSTKANNSFGPFGTFGIDLSGAGNSRLNPVAVSMCADKALQLDDFLTENSSGYRFSAHIAAFMPMQSTDGNEITSAYFADGDTVETTSQVYVVGDNGTILSYAAAKDFGDAPDPKHPSFLYNNGARHADTDVAWLGDSVTTEPDAYQSKPDAFDDGIEFVGSSDVTGGPYSLPYRPGSYGAVTVEVSGAAAETCYLHGWIDWNGDGDWDDDQENSICGYACTAPGSYTIEFTIPENIITTGCTWARFRLDIAENMCAYSGLAQYGEVEDYEICPTLIELSSLTATPSDSKVIISWTTESEIDNTGFNLHRSTRTDAGYSQINTGLIAARGTPNQGSTYSYTDEAVTNGTTYYYQLEDIDATGKSTMHGPVSATPDTGASTCDATDTISVRAGTPRYNGQSADATSCYSDIILKNTGDTDSMVYWHTTDSYTGDKTWQSVLLAPGQQHTGSDAWGYVNLNYDVTRIIATGKVVAYFYEDDYMDSCGWIGEDIDDDGVIDGSVASLSVSNMSPCH
ncbi:GEVED domain-containing protein [Thermodesulfobacteriota bacterium]